MADTVIVPSSGNGDGMGVGLILGIILAVILVVLFVIFGLPALKQEPQQETTNINIELPAPVINSNNAQ